jgi:hypothetical protein
MLYEERIQQILLDKMGLETFTPKFLRVVKKAGTNIQKNEPGKRYLFLVPVNDGGNTLADVEKLKAIVQSLHQTEFENEHGRIRKFSIISLSPFTLEAGQETTAMYHLGRLAVPRVKEEPLEFQEADPVGCAGGGGPRAVIKEERISQDRHIDLPDDTHESDAMLSGSRSTRGRKGAN